MSFTGNLEDLAIVDVIQLLHTTRKSGTLCVKGKKGEGQLVFQDGLIISAKHPDTSLRTGDYLVAMNFITQQVLDDALAAQKASGKPLIATLIEQGKIKKDEAFKGLETLVDMTVVEMVRWTKGTFTLDVDSIAVDDEFSYFPEKLVLDTQMVLMDALRIYDEKARDGEFDNEDPEPAADTSPAPGDDEPVSLTAQPEEQYDSPDLTLDDLGLSDFDKVEKKVPDVFTALEAFDPSEIHRQVIRKTLPDIAASQQEELVDFLTEYSTQDQTNAFQKSRALILFSDDELVKHAVMTICKYDQIMVYIAEQEQDLLTAIEQTLKRGLSSLIVFDKIESIAEIDQLELQKRVLTRHGDVPVLQLTSATDYRFVLDSLRNGILNTLAKPTPLSRPETFVDDYLTVLKTFRIQVERLFSNQGNKAIQMLGQYVASLQSLTEARDISFSLLQTVSELFARTLTLVVKQDELIAERGLGDGIKDKQAMLFRIPLHQVSIFQQVAASGKPFFGITDDPLLDDGLYKHISPPANREILLLPIKNRGRTIALIYGDFNDRKAQPLNLDTLGVLADLASLALENSLYQKQLKKQTA